MSKSKNNFYTLEDIEKHGIDLQAFRLIALQSHYRTEAQFSWKNLSSAQNLLNKYQAMADLRFQAVQKSPKSAASRIAQSKTNILRALSDDLNSPQSLTEISSLEDFLSYNLISVKELPDYIDLLEYINKLLGIDLLKSVDINDHQKNLINKRASARKSKNWELSDQIRNELLSSGIELRDTPQGQIWNRIASSSSR